MNIVATRHPVFGLSTTVGLLLPPCFDPASKYCTVNIFFFIWDQQKGWDQIRTLGRYFLAPGWMAERSKALV